MSTFSHFEILKLQFWVQIVMGTKFLEKCLMFEWFWLVKTLKKFELSIKDMKFWFQKSWVKIFKREMKTWKKSNETLDFWTQSKNFMSEKIWNIWSQKRDFEFWTKDMNLDFIEKNMKCSWKVGIWGFWTQNEISWPKYWKSEKIFFDDVIEKKGNLK